MSMDPGKFFNTILPVRFKTKIMSITSIPGGIKDQSYCCEVRIGVRTVEEFKLWLKEHEQLSHITYRVKGTNFCNGTFVTYKAQYRCQHNTYPRGHKVKVPSAKHTKCLGKLAVTIKNVPKRSRSKDIWLGEYPTIVFIYFNHNHATTAPETMRQNQDPTDDTKFRFLNLFKAGHEPSEALELHKENLKEEYGENYIFAVTNRSLCPDIRWVRRLHSTLFKELYGEGSVGNMFQPVREQVNKLKYDGLRISFQEKDGDQFCLALCTPLMERTHTLKSSGDICFLDSTGNVDRFNCRVFLILTDSKVGGLPLGVLVTSCESEDIITSALKLYLGILPENCFGERGKSGPRIFTTNDIPSLTSSLKKCFPETELRLCVFHVLQMAWKWLWDCKDIVSKDEKQCLFAIISKLVYCETRQEFEVELLQSLNHAEYPQFLKYLQNLAKKLDEWAVHSRRTVLTGDNDTNDIIDVTFRALKDRIFGRTRSFSIPQLLKFISSDLGSYYEKKIFHVMNNKYDEFFHSRYRPTQMKPEALDVMSGCADPHQFVVVNLKNSKEYIVDLSIASCTCYLGMNGSPCRHQHVVALNKSLAACNSLPFESEYQADFCWIATGSETIPSNWSDSLKRATPQKRKRPEEPTCSNYTEIQTQEMELAVGVLMSDLNVNYMYDQTVTSEPADDEELLKKQCESELKLMQEKILNRVHANPQGYLTAIQEFHKSLYRLTTDESLISALHMFGKQVFLPNK